MDLRPKQIQIQEQTAQPQDNNPKKNVDPRFQSMAIPINPITSIKPQNNQNKQSQNNNQMAYPSLPQQQQQQQQQNVQNMQNLNLQQQQSIPKDNVNFQYQQQQQQIHNNDINPQISYQQDQQEQSNQILNSQEPVFDFNKNYNQMGNPGGQQQQQQQQQQPFNQQQQQQQQFQGGVGGGGNSNINNNNKNQGNQWQKESGVFGKMKQFANTGLNYLKIGIGKAENKYDAAKETQAFQKMQQIKAEGLIKAGEIKDKLGQEFDRLDQKKKEFMEKQKFQMNVWMRAKLEYIILQLLEKARPEIKDLIHDPYMCKCVEAFIDDVIDDVWPEIEDKILHHLRMKISEPVLWEEKKPEFVCPLSWPWYQIRRWYLYSVDPYNRSIWYQMRTVTFWIIFLISCVSIYSIQSILFTIIFLMIDKKDEWQLIKYITVYKRMQFIAYGVLQGVIGYIQFFMCGTFNNHNTIEERKNCVENGPGSEFSIIIDSVGFLLQIFLIWISFLCLPCTYKASHRFKFVKPKRQYEDYPKQIQCCCCTVSKQNGGYLKVFMLYDLFSFLFCIGLIFLTIFVLEYDKQYQVRQTVYLMKILYGVLSFPFMLFCVGTTSEILTSSVVTGYDRYGNTAPKQIIHSKEAWEKSDAIDKERRQKNKEKRLKQQRKDRIKKEKKQGKNVQDQQQQQQQQQQQRIPNQQGRNENDDLLAVDIGEFMH